MLAAAERVEAVECAHSLEAEVRELRLIAAHAPPYNRRSKYPGAGGLAQADRRGVPAAVGGPRSWPTTTRPTSGPFSLAAGGRAGRGRRPRRAAAAPVHAASSRPARTTPACALAELGRCPAPCEHRITPEEYDGARPPRRSARRPPATRGAVVERAAGPHRRAVRRAALRGGGGGPGPAGRAAAGHRPHAAAGRADRHRRAGRRPARPPPAAGSCVVRHGRLAAAGDLAAAASIRDRTLDMLRATAETVLPGPGPVPARHRRGDRADPGLAGAAGDPAGGDVRRLGVTRRGARRASATCSTRAEAAASATRLVRTLMSN